MSASIALPLRVGARTLWTVRRRLIRVPLSLAEVLDGRPPALPPLEQGVDGHLVTSLPEKQLSGLLRAHPELTGFVRQRYGRSFAALDQPFDHYLAGFSAKSRSTLRRKLRKFAERSGGNIDLRTCRMPAEVEPFFRHARAVSEKSYQERLLGAGLPEGPEAMAEMRALAAQGAMRLWLLFLDGEPVSYLYAPAEGETLVYAHLGYDPAHAALSPGTVLQLEAMRQLMEEGHWRLFDFTEGEGQHKSLFATGAVECVDLLLVRRTISNLLVGMALTSFDSAVAAGKQILSRLGLARLARRLRR